MPKHKFQLTIDNWKKVEEFPDAWPVSRLREVLALLEYDDPVSDEDLAEIVLMLLEDLGPRLGTEVVLEEVFGDQMSAGVRQNIAEDLQEDEPWSQHAVVAQQAGIFAAVVLLQRAMPKYFGEPEAVRLELTIESSVPEAQSWLIDTIDPALVARLLAQGMEPEATLNRLYEDELEGESFVAAKDILWCISKVDKNRYSVTSSNQWLAPLEHRKSWSAIASGDRATNNMPGKLSEIA